MAEAIRAQIRQLEEFGKLQRRFTSDVSHELRTPLTTVRMAADVLHAGREDFPPHLSRSTELLVDELDRFESLLADLLEISRYDAGMAELERRADRHPVQSSAPRSARRPPLAEQSGIQIVTIVPDRSGGGRDRRPAGRADPAQPARQRDRPRRGQTGGARARRRRGRRWRSPSPTTASACGRARPAWCSTGSGGRTRPGNGRPAAPGWAWRSRWRTPGCTAAGCRRRARPGEGARFRLTLPRKHGGLITQSPLPLRIGADAPAAAIEVQEAAVAEGVQVEGVRMMVGGRHAETGAER